MMSNEVAHKGLCSVAAASGFGRQPDLLAISQAREKCSGFGDENERSFFGGQLELKF